MISDDEAVGVLAFFVAVRVNLTQLKNRSVPDNVFDLPDLERYFDGDPPSKTQLVAACRDETERLLKISAERKSDVDQRMKSVLNQDNERRFAGQRGERRSSRLSQRADEREKGNPNDIAPLDQQRTTTVESTSEETPVVISMETAIDVGGPGGSADGLRGSSPQLWAQGNRMPGAFTPGKATGIPAWTTTIEATMAPETREQRSDPVSGVPTKFSFQRALLRCDHPVVDHGPEPLPVVPVIDPDIPPPIVQKVPPPPLPSPDPPAMALAVPELVPGPMGFDLSTTTTTPGQSGGGLGVGAGTGTGVIFRQGDDLQQYLVGMEDHYRAAVVLARRGILGDAEEAIVAWTPVIKELSRVSRNGSVGAKVDFIMGVRRNGASLHLKDAGKCALAVHSAKFGEVTEKDFSHARDVIQDASELYNLMDVLLAAQRGDGTAAGQRLLDMLSDDYFSGLLVGGDHVMSGAMLKDAVKNIYVLSREVRVAPETLESSGNIDHLACLRTAIGENLRGGVRMQKPSKTYTAPVMCLLTNVLELDRSLRKVDTYKIVVAIGRTWDVYGPGSLTKTVKPFLKYMCVKDHPKRLRIVAALEEIGYAERLLPAADEEWYVFDDVCDQYGEWNVLGANGVAVEEYLEREGIFESITSLDNALFNDGQCGYKNRGNIIAFLGHLQAMGGTLRKIDKKKIIVAIWATREDASDPIRVGTKVYDFIESLWGKTTTAAAIRRALRHRDYGQLLPPEDAQGAQGLITRKETVDESWEYQSMLRYVTKDEYLEGSSPKATNIMENFKIQQAYYIDRSAMLNFILELHEYGLGIHRDNLIPMAAIAVCTEDQRKFGSYKVIEFLHDRRSPNRQLLLDFLCDKRFALLAIEDFDKGHVPTKKQFEKACQKVTTVMAHGLPFKVFLVPDADFRHIFYLEEHRIPALNMNGSNTGQDVVTWDISELFDELAEFEASFRQDDIDKAAAAVKSLYDKAAASGRDEIAWRNKYLRIRMTMRSLLKGINETWESNSGTFNDAGIGNFFTNLPDRYRPLLPTRKQPPIATGDFEPKMKIINCKRSVTYSNLPERMPTRGSSRRQQQLTDSSPMLDTPPLPAAP